MYLGINMYATYIHVIAKMTMEAINLKESRRELMEGGEGREKCDN